MQRPVVQNAFCIRNFFEAARTVAGGQRKRGSLVEKVFGKQKAFTAGLISHSVGEFFYGTDLAGQPEYRSLVYKGADRFLSDASTPRGMEP